MTEKLTIENLELQMDQTYDALICYKHHVCLATMIFSGEYKAEIYNFIENPEMADDIESPLFLAYEADMTFMDSGSAIKWCFDKIDGGEDLKKLVKIAQKNILTMKDRKGFERRYNDSEDFLDIAIWELENALVASYELGKRDANDTKEEDRL